MRVGLLIPGFPGQTHSFFWNEKQELRKLGLQVDFISTAQPKNHEARHSWQPQAAKETLYLTPPGLAAKVRVLMRASLNSPIRWAKIAYAAISQAQGGGKDLLDVALAIPPAAALCTLIRDRKIAHIHCHMLGRAAIIAALASYATGCPYSLTLHADISLFGNNQPLKWRRSSFATVVAPHLLTAAVAASGYPSENITIQPMGVDTDFFSRKAPYTPTAPGEPLRLASCGRIHPAKGHLLSLKIVHALRQAGIDTHLDILGADDSNDQRHLAELTRHARELKVEAQVSFKGSSSQEDVREALGRAHVYLHSSRDESVGIAIVEAMAMQVPCVVAETPGTSQLISDQMDGFLFPQGDALRASHLIAALASNPPLCQQIGAMARLKATAKYSARERASTLASLLSRHTRHQGA